MTASGYQLLLGGQEMHEFHGDGFRLKLLRAESDFGNPVPVPEMMNSLLHDGNLVRTNRDGNRLPRFILEVTADTLGDMEALEAGEALVMPLLRRINTMTWVVPGGHNAVIDIVNSDSEHLTDVADEIINGRRLFRLNFECFPYPHSEDEEQIAWAGPAAVLRAVTSVTGWAVSTGTRSATTNGDIPCIQCSSGSPVVTATPVAPLDDFLWLRSNHNGGGVGIDGFADLDLTITTPSGSTVIPDTEIWNVGKGVTDRRYLLMADVSAWKGITPTSISFKMFASTNARIYGFDTTSYPNLPILDLAGGAWSGSEIPTGTLGRGVAHANFGIGVLSPLGTARAPCVIKFTAPAGGALVVTGPDPVVALRDRGMAEMAFGFFTVTDPDGVEITMGGRVFHFPQGDHVAQIGSSLPQPLALNPGGPWPQVGTGLGTIGDDTTASQFAWPADDEAAASAFMTTGAKTLITPTIILPDGYAGDADPFEEHVVWPGRWMFGVMDKDGNPIAATIDYTPYWIHWPAA